MAEGARKKKAGTRSREEKAPRIPVTDDIFLARVRAGDEARYVELLNDRDIYRQTLEIPHPYTEADAHEWIARNRRWWREGIVPGFSIRNAADELMGGIGFGNLKPGTVHAAEIGYWLGKPYWGKGIMTAVVGKIVEIGFLEYGLERITAHVFTTNAGSERVLVKSGFLLEGVLRKYYLKDGQFVDSKLYALLREDWEKSGGPR